MGCLPVPGSTPATAATRHPELSRDVKDDTNIEAVTARVCKGIDFERLGTGCRAWIDSPDPALADEEGDADARSGSTSEPPGMGG